MLADSPMFAGAHYRAILHAHNGAHLLYDDAHRPPTRPIQLTEYNLPPLTIVYIRLP